MFDTVPSLDCAGRALRLDRPRVMGIVNVTPDSFSDGGDHFDADAAVAATLDIMNCGPAGIVLLSCVGLSLKSLGMGTEAMTV